MTFIIIFVCVFVAGIGFRLLMWKAVKEGASTLPVGTIRTYSYTGKSGGLSEQFSKMGMEQHINMMITNGWDVVNQVGLPGHVRLGRTVTGAALTGGLSLLAGGSRTADRVSITYRRVQVPGAVTSEHAMGAVRPAQAVLPASNPLAGYCNSCGSVVHAGSRFCSYCGATVEPHAAGSNSGGPVQGQTTITAGQVQCAVCKFLNPLDAVVCINCGTALNESIPAAPPPRPSNPETATPGAGNKAKRWVWVCIAAVIVVVIGIVSVAPRTPVGDDPLAKEGLSPDFCKKYPSADICGGPPPSSHSSPAISTPPEKPPDPAVQKAASVDATTAARTSNDEFEERVSQFVGAGLTRGDAERSVRAAMQNEAQARTAKEPAHIRPPSYRAYKSQIDDATAYIVAVGTTDEQLKNLLWFFRKKVREGAFADIGITKPTSQSGGQYNYKEGRLIIYRRERCADEVFFNTTQLGNGDVNPCGYGEHFDAYYQWGFPPTNRDGFYDEGGIRARSGELEFSVIFQDQGTTQ